MADRYFRMESNSSPSLEIDWASQSGGGVCQQRSQDTQGVCYANGTRLNGSNVDRDELVTAHWGK